MLYLNCFRDDHPIVEDAPQGDASTQIRLDERAERCAVALLALGSFEVSHLLAAVYLAGVKDAQREARRAS
jgi:hypothetical protein